MDTHYNSSFQDFYNILPNKVNMKNLEGENLILNVSKFSSEELQEIHLYTRNLLYNMEISIYKINNDLIVNGIPFITRGYTGQGGYDISTISTGSTILNVYPANLDYPIGIAENVFCTVGGIGTKACNTCEVALGKYNYSSYNQFPEKATVYSYGIGNSNEDRKNAFEIKGNGDAYILGVGGYTGSNFETSSTIQDILNKVNTVVINLNKDTGTFTLPSEELAKIKTITDNSNVIITTPNNDVKFVPISYYISTANYKFTIAASVFAALVVMTGDVNLETGVCELTSMHVALTEM